jgi:argininosuccinate lyase
MPQKKNPEVLEVIRARASYAIGDLVASVAALKSLPSTYNLDFQEITPKLWTSVDNLEASLVIFSKLIPSLKVSENIERKAAEGFVGATELANMLVRKYKVAFRTSHRIVGALVKSLLDSKQTLADATTELLQKVALESSGLRLTVKQEDIVQCTNLHKLVESYKVQGGPSPVAVEVYIKAREESMDQTKNKIAMLKKNLNDAERNLDGIVESYASSNRPSNVRFKNSNLQVE